MLHIVIDTNLLLLLAIGQSAPRFIEKHKRLRAFRSVDYELLVQVMAPASKVTATPNALTELSNLACYGVGEPLRGEIVRVLSRLMGFVEEVYLQSKVLVRDPGFGRLGLADCSLLHALDDGAVLLTDDLPLYLEARRRGWQATNFTHLREANGLL